MNRLQILIIIGLAIETAAVSQQCRTTHASSYGVPKACLIDNTLNGYVLQVKTLITFKQNVTWTADSWNYQLQDSKGNAFQLRGANCEDKVNNPGSYRPEFSLLLSFVCRTLPRRLFPGDSIKIIAFTKQSGANWLIYNVPLDFSKGSQEDDPLLNDI